MKVDIGGLKRFERRVRLVRAWRGLAIGLCAGAAACAVWAALDWMRLAYAEWSGLGVVLVAGGLGGLLAGLFGRVPSKALSDSIDRRGGLQNRLTTSMEVQGATEFEEALQNDAASRLGSLQPKQLYPMKVGRWQASALLLSVLASTIFLLGNSPILLSPEARHEREELKKLGETVQRIAKPVTEAKSQTDMTEAEKRLVDEVRKLQRDLEKARLSKEEAMQKTNDLAKKAQELTKTRSEMTEQNLSKAESAFDKLAKAEMEKEGMKMDPETLKQLSKMSTAEKDAQKQAMEQKKQELQQKQADLQNKLNDINKQLKNPNLTPEQRKALEEMQKKIQEMQKKIQEMLKGLEKELKELQKAIEDMMKSEKIQELMKALQEHPAMKELQELAAKLAENAQAQKNGEMPKLTKEDIEKMMSRMSELKKQLEELADQLKDPKALDEFMEQLKEALKNAKMGGKCMGLGMGLMSLMGLPGMPAPGNDNDVMSVDTKQIQKNANGKEGAGSTTLTQIKGDRQKNGSEAYIEIKGPTTVGTRSSVKYTKVLPSYKKKAEEAIDKKAIPKQHEKRVKEYFDSLAGGK